LWNIEQQHRALCLFADFDHAADIGRREGRNCAVRISPSRPVLGFPRCPDACSNQCIGKWATNAFVTPISVTSLVPPTLRHAAAIRADPQYITLNDSGV
jgi:hypothetical protein